MSSRRFDFLRFTSSRDENDEPVKNTVSFAEEEEHYDGSQTIMSHVTSDETQAESSILKAVEQDDDDSPLTILPHVSEDEADAFTKESISEETEYAETPTKRNHTMSWSNHSLATRLAKLSSAMQKERSNENGGSMSHRFSRSFGMHHDGGTADAFVANCNTLFRVRHCRSKPPKANDEGDDKKHDVESCGHKDTEDDSSSGNHQGIMTRWRVFQSQSRLAQDSLWEFLESQQTGVRSYLRLRLILGIVLLGIAALLFYAFDNPLFRNGASLSWLFIFIVRQLVVVSLTRMTEHLVIGYLSLETRLTVRLLGTLGSLALVQSKGLPFRMVVWGLYCACLLGGSHQFAQHWLFYQDFIGMFNDENPSGEILSSTPYWTIIGITVGVGFVVSVKRLWWGLRVGRRTYEQFGDDVSAMIEKMLLLSEVSNWSHRSTKDSASAMTNRNFLPIKLEELPFVGGDSVEASSQTTTSETIAGVIDPNRRNPYTGSLNQSQQVRIFQLLGSWEEPEVMERKKEPASVSAILEFRQALSYMETRYPFSQSFGLADRRENCVDSAQQLYSRLASTSSGNLLSFEVVAQATVKRDGSLDQSKVKSLIRLFRPDRDGKITMLDFCKSIDRVYRDMKLLRASVKNASRMDNALEQIMNFIFYFTVILIVVAVVGINPSAMLATVSALIVGFSFMISDAASAFFAGIMLILFRRPYSIGDRIAEGSLETAIEESNTWFVQDVDLYTTVARSAATNQVVLLSNGALASEPIVNLNRSTKALRQINVKFNIGVEPEKLQQFRRSLEAHVKARPREWLSVNGFRPVTVDQDDRSVEYVVVLQHRESYQNWGVVLNSHAEVESFCVELSDELGIKYAHE